MRWIATRTVVVLTVSPLETHGPHLPLGVDAFTARHFAESIAERLVARSAGLVRPSWLPTLHLGRSPSSTVGTVRVRQRVVRDVVVDYGAALARARLPLHPRLERPRRARAPGRPRGGGRHRLAPPRRHDGLVHRPPGLGVPARPLCPAIEAELGRPLSAVEREAFAEDAHGGWWETSIMLVLRPDLVDDGYRTLPPRATRCCGGSFPTIRCATAARATWAIRRWPTRPSPRRPPRC